MPVPLRVLIVEDSEDDARLLHRRLELGGYAVQSERVETESATRAALARQRWDLILCDYMLPGFGGSQALAIANELDLGLPFILVSGKIDEEIAVEVMKAGASDFVTKAHLERLLPAVRRELASAAAHRGLRRAELEWRAALDAVQDPVFIHDADLRVVRANRAYAALAGMPVREVLGRPYWQVFPKAEGPLPGCAADHEAALPAEEAFVLPGGERYTSRSYPITDATGKYLYSVHVLLDVTERNRVQEAVERSERRFRALTEYASDLVVVCDAQGIITYCSPSVTRLAGYEAGEVVGRSFLEFLHPDEASAARASLLEIVRHPERPVATEFRFRHKNGSWFTLESIAKNALADPLLGGLVVNARDVTGRKKSEESLRLFRELIDRSSDGIEVVDAETLRYLDANQKACLDLGYTREELLARRVPDNDPTLDPAQLEAVDRRLRESGSASLETIHRRKDGSTFPVEVHIKRVHLDRVYNVISVRDITERRRDEARLKRLNWALRALSQSNSALVHARDEEELLRTCCEAITASDTYPLAWIGKARHDAERSVEILAAAGEATGYMDGFKLSWGDTPYGRGPSGTAIRAGKVQVLNEMSANEAFLPWLERARASGLRSSIAVPIRLEREVFGVLTVYSRERDAFGDDEVSLFEELAGDIGFGLGARRTRAAYEAAILERTRQAQKLRATFESAIGALAATVEQRDPYTAGHQRRVAELAVAIGRELGFDDERLAGLRIASTIHDIGKIYVPAEILARPGRLGEIEFEIVKSHAQVGYDIVKGVDFPWPVAQTILQHHERLDGSGYPQGLKDGQIILEARILAVADVVEAMSSHRPYRPGLGLEAALDTVGRQAGRALDADAVAACLRLFREKGYRLVD